MPKGERRRRRQAQEDGEQQNEALPRAPEEILNEQPGESSEDDRDETSEFIASPASGADETPTASGRRRPRPKRSALAEVIADPAFANAPVESIDPEPAATAPASPDLFSGASPQQDARSFGAEARSLAYGPQDEDVNDTQPIRDFASSPAPAYPAPPAMAERARGREGSTREPVLIALLLVALVVLLVDTYFVMHLNGRVDRLGAPTSTTAAAASATDRPWVGVVTATNQPFANGGQPVTTVRIVNSGHEPAYDLRSNTSGTLAPAATPAPKIPATKGQLAMTALLLPNVGGTLTFFANTRALTPEEAAKVRNGQLVLWLAGRLDYKDLHGHPHLTTFRYRYNPALNSFVATPEGNSAT